MSGATRKRTRRVEEREGDAQRVSAWRRRAARLGVERVLERFVADAAEEEHGGVRLVRTRTGGAPLEALSLLGEQLDAQHLRVAHCARARKHLLERVH